MYEGMRCRRICCRLSGNDLGPAQSPVSRGYRRLHATVAADPVNRRLSSWSGRSGIAPGRLIVVPAHFAPHQYPRSAFSTYPGNNGDGTAITQHGWCSKVKSACFKYSQVRGERITKAISWAWRWQHPKVGMRKMVNA